MTAKSTTSSANASLMGSTIWANDWMRPAVELDDHQLSRSIVATACRGDHGVWLRSNSVIRWRGAMLRSARLMSTAPSTAQTISVASCFDSASDAPAWRSRAARASASASKAGLIGLTCDLTVQWTGTKGIRVNAVAPGLFPSEMSDQFPADYVEGQIVRLPAGRLGDPAELAAAVVFLASDAAGYVTGTTLVVDGGISIL